jgi:hypothetical protein
MGGNPNPGQSWWSRLSDTTKRIVSALVAIATILSAFFGYLAVRNQFTGAETNQAQGNVQIDPAVDRETEPADAKPTNEASPSQPLEDNRQQTNEIDQVREAPRENPPVEPAPLPPPSPPPPNLSRNCPSQSILLRFNKPANISSVFNAVVDGAQVRMINCEPNSDFFGTRFAADRGSIDGTGRWSADRIQFEFGHHASFAGVHPVQCSVSGRGNGNRSYIGSLTCYDDDEHTLSVGNVQIEL